MEFIIISIISLITEGTTGFRLYGVFLSLFIFHILMLGTLTLSYLIKTMYLESKKKIYDERDDFKKYFDLFGLNVSFLILDLIIKTNIEDHNYHLTDLSLFLIIGYFLLAISKNLSILKK